MTKRKLPIPLTPEVISGSEQTGLIPALPDDEAEEDSYEELYPIHEQQDTKEQHDPHTGHRS